MPSARSVARHALLALVIAAAVAGARPAHAQTLDLAGGGMPSTVGRAGAGVVAADDGAALWLNPAGLARRSAWRAQLGLTWVARSASFASAERFGKPTPEARQLAPAEAVPALALEGHLGARLVVGLAWLEPTALVYEWAAPDPLTVVDEPADRAIYPARYAAGRLALRRRGAVAGASLRALPWLALGASAWLVRVDAEQSRSLWGAQGPIASLPNLSSAYDLRFAAVAHAYTPGGALGALVAPLDAPLELAVSLAFGADASLDGQPSLSDSRGMGSAGRLTTAQVAPGAAASLELPTPLVARAGVRFFGERLSLEVGAAVAVGGAVTPRWRVEGVGVTLGDGSASADVTDVPVGVALRDGLGLGAAFDADVVPGFLTLTAGWSYARGAVARSTLSPALPLLDASTFALGATARVDGYTVTIGASYAPARGVDVDPGAATVVAPLASGAPPAARGHLDASTTMVGLVLETEL